MIKYILLGAALSLMASPAAMALPAVSSGAAPSDIVKVHKGGHDKGNHWRKRDRWNNHYSVRNHDRYRGWNRYSYRPYGWRNRGCVNVGPVWYCS